MTEQMVIEKVSEVFEIPIGDIFIDSTPQTLKNWDSLRHMKLMIVLEMEIGKEIPAEQIIEMLSVRKIIEVVTALSA